MKNFNYVSTQFVCFLLYFIYNFVIIIGFGIYLFKFKIFVETEATVFIFLFFGWGFVQISMAFFLGALIEDSTSALIVGYAVTFYLIASATINNTILYEPPEYVPLMYHISPMITF